MIPWANIKAYLWAAAAAAGALLVALVYREGARSATDRARAQAAEAERRTRRQADAAGADAERDGAAKRLRDGGF